MFFENIAFVNARSWSYKKSPILNQNEGFALNDT